MIVVHYIPNLTKSMGQAAKSVQVLHTALARSVESHLYTGNASSLDFYRYIKTLHPDIIHVHGAWDVQIPVAQAIARHFNIPVVSSPHGALSPKYMQQEFWKQRFPRIITYQFLAIRRSFAVHAESEQEHADLKSLGWKNRINVISIAKESLEERQMVLQHIAFYQKVIDTTLRNKLSDLEQKAIWTMLVYEITSRHEDVAPEEETIKMLSSLTEKNWKQIQIYALDHGVYDRIINATKRLNVVIANPISIVPPRYSHKALWKDEKPIPLPQEIINEYKEENVEVDILTKTNNLYNTVLGLHKTPDCPYPLETFLELYETFRWQYYKEDVFEAIASKAKLITFVGKLMNVYNLLFDMPIGFMPVDPVKDKTTKQIINNLNNLP